MRLLRLLINAMRIMGSAIQSMIKQAFCLLIILMGLLPGMLQAQSVVVKGIVYDGFTGKALPGASVSVPKQREATATDMMGQFTLQISNLTKTTRLQISYVGYKTQIVDLPNNPTEVVEIYLDQAQAQLAEVVVTNKRDDPAIALIKKAVRNRAKNRRLKASRYSFTSYNKIAAFATRLDSSALRNLRVIKEMQRYLAARPNLHQDGRVAVPLLASEIESKVYTDTDRHLEREDVLSRRLSGIGLQDIEIASEFLTSKLNHFDFSHNQVRILNKYFTSPIADSWNIAYQYGLVKDSVYVDSTLCAELYIYPRSASSLSFRGSIWISLADYALKKVSLSIKKQTGINFVKSLAIEQNLVKTSFGWLPQSTNSQMTFVLPPSLLPDINIHYTTNNSKYTPLIDTLPRSFYIALDKPAIQEIAEQNYWNQLNPADSLAQNQGTSTYQLIDSLQSIPSVKKSVKFVRVLATGYIRAGKIDYGHILRFFAWNNVEGFRPYFSLKSNEFFHEKLFLSGGFGYGTSDKNLKYHAEIAYRLPTKKYSLLSFSRQDDVFSINVLGDNLRMLTDEGEYTKEGYALSNRFLNLAKKNPFHSIENKILLETDFSKNLTGRLGVNHLNLQPVITLPGASSNKDLSIQTTEMLVEASYQKTTKRVRLKNNGKLTVGAKGNPRITLSGIFGLKGVLGAQYQYQKIGLNIYQENANLGALGHATFNLNTGYIHGTLPAPLLRTHLGNPNPIYFNRAFNTLDFTEFISDKYATLHYEHTFESPFFDLLPPFRQLNKYLGLHVIASANVLFGDMNQANKNLLGKHADQTIKLNHSERSKTLDPSIPFLEAGLGINNILQFFSVGYYRRLTYLNVPTNRLWSVKAAVYFRF